MVTISFCCSVCWTAHTSDARGSSIVSGKARKAGRRRRAGVALKTSSQLYMRHCDKPGVCVCILGLWFDSNPPDRVKRRLIAVPWTVSLSVGRPSRAVTNDHRGGRKESLRSPQRAEGVRQRCIRLIDVLTSARSCLPAEAFRVFPSSSSWRSGADGRWLQ